MQSMLQQMYVRFQIDIRTVSEERMQLLLDISRLCGDIRTQKEHITALVEFAKILFLENNFSLKS